MLPTNFLFGVELLTSTLVGSCRDLAPADLGFALLLASVTNVGVKERGRLPETTSLSRRIGR